MTRSSKSRLHRRSAHQPSPRAVRPEPSRSRPGEVEVAVTRLYAVRIDQSNTRFGYIPDAEEQALGSRWLAAIVADPEALSKFFQYQALVEFDSEATEMLVEAVGVEHFYQLLLRFEHLLLPADREALHSRVDRRADDDDFDPGLQVEWFENWFVVEPRGWDVASA